MGTISVFSGQIRWGCRVNARVRLAEQQWRWYCPSFFSCFTVVLNENKVASLYVVAHPTSCCLRASLAETARPQRACTRQLVVVVVVCKPKRSHRYLIFNLQFVKAVDNVSICTTVSIVYNMCVCVFVQRRARNKQFGGMLAGYKTSSQWVVRRSDTSHLSSYACG